MEINKKENLQGREEPNDPNLQPDGENSNDHPKGEFEAKSLSEDLEAEQPEKEEIHQETSAKSLEEDPLETGNSTDIVSELPSGEQPEEDKNDRLNVDKTGQNAAKADLEAKQPIAQEDSNSATDKKDKSIEDSTQDNAKEENEKEEEEHHLDYSNYTKKQMVQVLETLLKDDNVAQVGKVLKEIKKPFDRLVAQERKDAFDKYIEDGGEKDGFEYRGDELDGRFHLAYNKLRDRKNEYYNSLEIRKEQNLKTKLEILEKLRHLVDSEETGASIKDLKELQVQWKEVGPVPSSQLKSLWANYNALLDRFYDNRSIYFELKELDRKKNYDLKIELCEKAEELSKQENIREVIKQLNELHEEFKHIGPVPKDDQDAVWERFKAASDSIYSRRKDYYEKLKEELKVNQVAKEALVEKVLPFERFDSEKISDWNARTKEIIAIQKEWEAIGSLPKDKAKKINKQFWSAFKGFFNNKGLFFKKIDEARKDNLNLKQELVDKAESLKDSDDFKKTSEELKKLQREWKNIGPVPEKHRNEIFDKFKKACDHFFNRRRANSEVIEKEYEENLKMKEGLCEEMEKMLRGGEVDLNRIKEIEEKWAEIGYVPRNSIKTIQRRYTDVIEAVTKDMDVSEEEKHKLRFKAQFSNMNFGPGSERVIQKKEGALRRQISNLENDISLWQNNIDFFASSKNADKLKKDFQVKIDKANDQLKNLKEQLKIISNI